MNRALNHQQLIWLLISLAIVLATHALNLPVWVLLASAAFGVWRFYIDQYQWKLPRIWLLLPITILMCLGIILSFKGFFGRDASLSLLVMMCALKLLETKTLRDYMLVIVLGYFLVGNLFLFNQTIATFALSIVPLILLTATLINISLHKNQTPFFTVKLAGKLLLQALPVMLILFLLFPRIPGPMWGVPQDAYSSMSGLSDNLQFGNVSNLIKNSSIAFRVKFNGAVPAQNQLYWRGPVLWHQEDSTWTMSSENIGLPLEQLAVTGKAISYTITLEPHNRLWLLMLDMPTLIPDNAKLRHDYSVVANSPVRTRIRYDAQSFNQYQLGTTLNEREKLLSLQINEGENPQTLQLASTWANLSPIEKVNAALNRYRQQPFIYTLKPPILRENAVDDFLFNTKRGFCEHYATSFVYLMRAAGVPARIVTGYQGGELNPNGNYLIVRQSDAHAWAEVWLQDQGWVRVDPTAAVAPERVEQSIAEALNDTDELPLMARPDYPWLKKAFLNWDNVNNGWNQWVLGYDDQKQRDFLKNLTGKNVSIQDIIVWMLLAVFVAAAATSYYLLRQNKIKLNPVQRHYAQYLQQLKRLGLVQMSGETALDFAKRAAIALPNDTEQMAAIAERYNMLMFSQSPNAGLLTEFSDQIKQFKVKQFKPNNLKR